jgi:RES domain-containing protein
VRVWRLCQRRYAALDGEGARLYGGRWNRPGVRAVYAPSTVSLAALELFVRLEREEQPRSLVVIPIDIPSEVRIASVEPAELPPGWRKAPGPEALQELGTRWASGLATAVLGVPSVIVPSERNYLLNPLHGDFSRIVAGRPEPFEFDPRMWK